MFFMHVKMLSFFVSLFAFFFLDIFSKISSFLFLFAYMRFCALSDCRNFLPLRCFLSTKMLSFFVFVRFYVFLHFLCVWNLFVKKVLSYPINLIYYTTEFSIIIIFFDIYIFLYILCLFVTWSKFLYSHTIVIRSSSSNLFFLCYYWIFNHYNLFQSLQSFSIITIFFDYHSLLALLLNFQSIQSFSIITIFFSHYNLFQLLQSFSIVTICLYNKQ